MALVSGTRLGSYEILDLIGKGGMGEVYRARDSRLKRDVAIKILPDELSRDSDRVSRFQREARVLASLNHEHIATIHELAESDGFHYLVLELVEGQTLAERLERGPIPLDETLAIAAQVARALQAAHELGIVHRDLKPANIKVTSEGRVKVLDFGLAKAFSSSPAENVPSDSPTLSLTATHPGIILGTAGYLAPEQARGKAVDQRADIWAFGAVLFEMVTGQKLFKGDDLTEIIASVVKEQPDLSVAPREIHKVLEACLQKDRHKRLQAIGDWSLLLEEDPPPIGTARSQRTKVPWIIAAITSLVLLGLTLVHFRGTTPPHRVYQLSVPVSDDLQITFLQISPDGRRLVLATLRNNIQQLYLRSLDSQEVTPLPSTTGARSPFWSPDSKSIGFFADNSLKVVAASGGPARVLCKEAGLGGGGTWSKSGDILIGAGDDLRHVNEKNGECVGIGKPDSGIRGTAPTFASDGKHFFYAGRALSEGVSFGIYLATLDDFPGRKVLPDASSVIFAPPVSAGASPHILFVRETTLMAQPLDESSLLPVGDPFKVADRASFSFTNPQIAASVAPNGTLVYLAGRSLNSQLTIVDGKGNELRRLGTSANYVGVTLSPDGNKATVTRMDANLERTLLLHDFIQASESRLTPAGSQGFIRTTLWSNDSNQIWFGMIGTEGSGLYEKNLRNGVLRLVRALSADDRRTPSDLSRDGRYLVYTREDPKNRSDIWYEILDAGKPVGEPVPFIATAFEESQGQLSPKNDWLAYASYESSKVAVYLRSFPKGDKVLMIPGDGGREPRWRSDGKELFFVSAVGPDRVALYGVAIDLSASGDPQIKKPEKLFEFSTRVITVSSNAFSYSPFPDGRRFLLNVAENAQPTVNVITGWQQALGRGN